MNTFKILFILKISVTLFIVLLRYMTKNDSTDTFTGEVINDKRYETEHYLDQSTNHLMWFAQVISFSLTRISLIPNTHVL